MVPVPIVFIPLLPIKFEFGFGLLPAMLKLPVFCPLGIWVFGCAPNWLLGCVLLPNALLFDVGLVDGGRFAKTAPLAEPNVGWAGCDHGSDSGEAAGCSGARPESRTVGDVLLPRMVGVVLLAAVLSQPDVQFSVEFVEAGAADLAGSASTLGSGGESLEAIAG